MRDMDLEHPDITAALKTGYPQRKSTVYVPCCDMCHEPVTNAEWYFAYGDEIICGNCVDGNRHNVEDAFVDMGCD